MYTPYPETLLGCPMLPTGNFCTHQGLWGWESPSQDMQLLCSTQTAPSSPPKKGLFRVLWCPVGGGAYPTPPAVQWAQHSGSLAQTGSWLGPFPQAQLWDAACVTGQACGGSGKPGLAVAGLVPPGPMVSVSPCMWEPRALTSGAKAGQVPLPGPMVSKLPFSPPTTCGLGPSAPELGGHMLTHVLPPLPPTALSCSCVGD
ncbi:hypothetical protein DR999_PMT19967 [Platysternon megacephalum]|uniref:Uncharacterized protein n=1 Tax=Platysternon megacephalum TaxID=55544 RepID=A0A4D9DTB4_9SAUR|nr:hypothetical protein DR999_PMT19967 [Platysternon megacephalum]